MPKPQARAAAQLFPGGWAGLPEPLRRNAFPLSHLGARARGTFAQYRSFCGPEGRHHVSSCGGGRSDRPPALQSKALPAGTYLWSISGLEKNSGAEINSPHYYCHACHTARSFIKSGMVSSDHLASLYATRPVAAIPTTTKAISRFFWLLLGM